MAVQSREEAADWALKIKNTAQSASVRDTQKKEMERQLRIAKELSNLIVYCRSVAFSADQIKKKDFLFYEMSSFPEAKAEKLMCQTELKFFLKYHQVIKLFSSCILVACIYYRKEPHGCQFDACIVVSRSTM
jgi:hypothetical protein